MNNDQVIIEKYKELLPDHGDGGCVCLLCAWKETIERFILEQLHDRDALWEKRVQEALEEEQEAIVKGFSEVYQKYPELRVIVKAILHDYDLKQNKKEEGE